MAEAEEQYTKWIPVWDYYEANHLGSARLADRLVRKDLTRAA
jgi:hypothetical protein